MKLNWQPPFFMIIYTLLKVYGEYSDYVCSYCGTYDSIDKAVAHRDSLIANSSSFYERVSAKDFEILRTRCNQAVCIDARDVPAAYDVFADEKETKREAVQRAWEDGCKQRQSQRLKAATKSDMYAFLLRDA